MNYLQQAYGLLYSSNRITDDLYLPVILPILRANRRWIVFGACRCSGPPAPDRPIFAPHFLAYVDYPAAKELVITDVQPNDIGLAGHDPKKPIGTWKEMAHLKHGEYTEKGIRYEELLLKLLENNWLSDGKAGTKDRKEVAEEISSLLSKICLPSLEGYYQWAGGELFQWLKSQTQGEQE